MDEMYELFEQQDSGPIDLTIVERDLIARALPNDRIAIQWDVCQEVLAWEGYYDKGPVDFRTETLDVLTRIGDGVRLVNERGVEHGEGDGYYIRNGIVIVPKNETVPAGTVV